MKDLTLENGRWFCSNYRATKCWEIYFTEFAYKREITSSSLSIYDSYSNSGDDNRRSQDTNSRFPGIVEGAAKGRGMGKRVLSVARNADLVLTILDVFHPRQIQILHKELAEIGIKVDKKPPDVRIEKSKSGGLAIQILTSIKLSESLIREILRINGIHNGRIVIREPGLTDEDLIDLLSGNKVYLPSLPILNKIDLVPKNVVDKLKSDFGFIPVSADRNINIDNLKRAIYEKLDFIRIYLKPRGGKAHYEEPLIMKRNCSILDICNKLHRNFARDYRYANVWGNSVKFDQQKVGLDHVLKNNDVVTIMTR